MSLLTENMGGFRSKGFTVIVTCKTSGGQGAEPIPRTGTSFALHPVTLLPVLPLFSLQAASMSAVQVEIPVLGTRRRILTGVSMPKSKACRKLVFSDPSPDNDREEDAAEDSSMENILQEHLHRQNERWGFNFQAGQPLANGRLEWVGESEERVPAFYRESCLRSPPRRSLRAVRRNIMSARASESTEQYHSSDNGTLAYGQVDTDRVMPGNNLPEPVVSNRSETETASVAVSTSSAHRQKHEGTSEDNKRECNNAEAHNNGLIHASRPSTSQARRTQSHIDEFFSQRKRRRSSSEDSSAKRAKSLPDLDDRPHSAPAAVATS